MQLSDCSRYQCFERQAAIKEAAISGPAVLTQQVSLLVLVPVLVHVESHSKPQPEQSDTKAEQPLEFIHKCNSRWPSPHFASLAGQLQIQLLERAFGSWLCIKSLARQRRRRRRRKLQVRGCASLPPVERFRGGGQLACQLAAS